MKRYLGQGPGDLNHRSFYSWRVDVCPSPSIWIHSSTQKLPNLCLLAFFWCACVCVCFVEVSSHSPDCMLTQPPVPLLSLEVGGGVEMSKLLINIWAFWVPAPAQSSLGTCQELPHLNKRCCYCLYHSENSKVFISPYAVSQRHIPKLCFLLCSPIAYLFCRINR